MYISLEKLAQFNEFVLRLHQCDNIGQYAEIVMSGLQKVVPYESGAFFSVDPAARNFVSSYHVDIDAALFEQYTSYYQEHDLYRKIVFSTRPMPPIDRCSDFLDFAEWKKNEHRADFLLPNLMYYLAGIQLVNQGQLLGDISIHRTNTQTDYDDGEMRLLEMLAPHIQYVFAKMMNSERNKFDDLLNQRDIGVCVFDAKVNCLYCNKKADDVFVREGKQLLARIADTCAAIIASPLRLTSYNGELFFSGRQFCYDFVTVRDRNKGDIYIVSFDTGLEKRSGDNIPITRFTAREAEIMRLLAKGCTNRQIGEILYISPETVKTHLKNLFIKTGTSSRTELATHGYRLFSGR